MCASNPENQRALSPARLARTGHRSHRSCPAEPSTGLVVRIAGITSPAARQIPQILAGLIRSRQEGKISAGERSLTPLGATRPTTNLCSNVLQGPCLLIVATRAPPCNGLADTFLGPIPHPELWSRRSNDPTEGCWPLDGRPRPRAGSSNLGPKMQFLLD